MLLFLDVYSFQSYYKMCEFLRVGRKFVTLSVGMKGIMMKICAVLLAVWYCMSIIGFDVHTCNGSGRTFVATFAEGLTCEDIHPEHHCTPGQCRTSHDAGCCHEDCCSHSEKTCSHETSEGSCCGHEGESELNSPSCCSDSYQSILLTGVRADDDHRHYDECHSGIIPCIISGHLCGLADRGLAASHMSFHLPDIGDIVPCDRQVAFSVWRI